MSKILAIDYGTKRVGIAVTDDLQIIASGLTTVHSSELVTFLEAYFKQNNVEAIVVGMPKTLQNERADSTKEVEKIVTHLTRKFPAIRIETIDERFTSSLASKAILQSGLKKKQRKDKSLIDEVSATIILQDYLQQKTNGFR
ncbi:MAG: Holliday junction resolvase RuvX [Flavobacteriales bacterium]|nr:Holliday junction resolvase RuvX [Flavobacteriales bacterium]